MIIVFTRKARKDAERLFRPEGNSVLSAIGMSPYPALKKTLYKEDNLVKICILNCTLLLLILYFFVCKNKPKHFGKEIYDGGLTFQLGKIISGSGGI